MTDIRKLAEEIIEASEKATPGPWKDECGEVVAFILDEGEDCLLLDPMGGFATEADYQFIALSRTAAPELARACLLLLDENEKLKAEKKCP